MVQDCRKGVMEFLLVNHPLDCPICDQAGECRLQEFSVEYGKSESRFLERKIKKTKRVELGPRVTLDAERCILCSRCIRFMKEVAQDDVLGFVDRGGFSTIACHPNKTLESNYSLNTVDICPVGALTSSDFRFKMRVWFLKETKSIDVNDGLGSNIIIGSRENRIYRITPRENNDVNGCWLPDSHRLNFKYLTSDDRLVCPQVAGVNTDWSTAIHAAIAQLRALPGQVALIVSARLTNEELYLAKLLATSLSISLYDIVPRTAEPDGILIPADRNPNTSGAKLIGMTSSVPGEAIKDIANGVRAGKISGILTLGEDLCDIGLSESEIASLSSLVSVAITTSTTTRLSTVLLPGSAWAEKRGSMVNIHNRIQRLNKAVEPPGECRDDWEILRDLTEAASNPTGFTSIEEVFSAMSKSTAHLSGLSLSRIGDLGVDLSPKL
jgi:NADH-quinone oxidoreductase subunit G